MRNKSIVKMRAARKRESKPAVVININQSDKASVDDIENEESDTMMRGEKEREGIGIRISNKQPRISPKVGRL